MNNVKNAIHFRVRVTYSESGEVEVFIDELENICGMLM